MNRILSLLKDVYVKAFAGRRQARRWMAGIAGKDDIKVFYGHEHVPGRDEVAQGGIVKCQDLSEMFPNSLEGANIVYLVSSALPPAVQSLVKAARSAGAKVIVNQNGVAYPAWHGEGWERTNRPMKELAGIADYVVYQSEFCKKSADRYLGPCRGSWEILHNPVDTSVFVPGPQLSMDRGPVLLVSGSHMQFYRVESVIRAFAHVVRKFENAKLLIAGHLGWRATPEEAEREAMALCRELSIEGNVEMLGRYTQRQAVPILHSAHMLVHTKYNDPCPRMVVEAMSCGLPVIYSASGGTSELVGNDAGVGVAVPQGWESLHSPSPEEIAESVGLVVDGYDDFSKAARAKAVEQLDVRSWISRHQSIFSELLADGDRSGAKGK